MIYYVAVESPDAGSAQDTPVEIMELDEIPVDQDDDDDEKDELASDAEGVVVSTSLLLRPWPSWVPGGADMRTRLTGCLPGSQDGKNLAPWQQKRAETKAKNTARKQRKSKQDTELNAKRKELQKQKARYNVYMHRETGC